MRVLRAKAAKRTQENWSRAATNELAQMGVLEDQDSQGAEGTRCRAASGELKIKIKRDGKANRKRSRSSGARVSSGRWECWRTTAAHGAQGTRCRAGIGELGQVGVLEG